MNAAATYTFDIAVLPRPADTRAGQRHEDPWGSWETLSFRATGAAVLGIDFEVCLERLTALPRMFVEPDGALLWVGDGAAWQVDGTAWERDGQLLRIDLKGRCPEEAFDAFLRACGWPTEPLMVELVRPAVLLDIETFRRHALARGMAAPGEDLRSR